jgi:hypothetical protein
MAESVKQETEDCETIYLKDDEIDKFMEDYLKRNPNTEVEVRYLNSPPKEIEYTQEIQVKWLRPETPNTELPPIIIREVSEEEVQVQKPLKIIEQSSNNETCEPLVIRETPPSFKICPKIHVVDSKNLQNLEYNQNTKF